MAAVDSDSLSATRTSRAEGMARELEQRIVDAGLTAGERLGTKTDLRLQFRVAVATVNEALRLLEARGLVELRPGPGGGVFVAAPSSRVRLNHLVLGFKLGDAPFSDCLVVRNALEPLVCREAARYCKPRDAAALREIIERMEGALADPALFLRLNWELHRYLAKMCQNVPLKGLYLTLLDYVQDGLADVESDDGFDPKGNLKVHQRLVEAVIAGDGRRLERAIADHTPIADRWVDGPA
jgi:DNA-binding FadR family transcriptional regulator